MTKVVKRSLLFVMTVVLALCAFMTVGAMSAKADGTVITPIGASIRLNEGSTGIRFEASISQEVEGATYGFIIVPDYYLDGIDGDYGPALSDKYSGNIITLQSFPVDGVIKGSVANIKPQNYGLTYAGIPFEVIPETDSAIYGEIMYASVLDVASAAKIDTVENYEAEELAIIDDFYAKGIVAEGKEDYVATFDGAAYVANAFDFAASSPASGHQQYSESGIVTDYNGTENVAKYYFATGSENGNGIHTSCIIKIKLPQAYGADGYTIRYALVYEDAFADANFIFKSESAGTSLTDIYVNELPVNGEWTEQYVNTSGATDDEIYIHFHKGLTSGRVFTLYIDWVKDGDVNGVSQVEVPEGYLATFTNETYVSTAFSFAEQVPGVGGYTTMEGNGTVVTYNDVENVGRYHFITGAENGIHTSCIIKIALPNDLAHGANGYTIRYAVEYTSNWEGGNLYFRNGGGASSTAYLQLNGNTFPANGVWTETYVDTNGTEGNAIYMHIHKGGVQNVEVNLYIEWIKDGDQIPWGTEEGELGSFNSDKYLADITLPFAGTSNGVGQSLVSAEILESVELGGVTESTVLKVVVNSGQDVNGLGHVTAGVKIPLAEKYTAAGYTVRWAINFPSLANGNVRFFESAYANGGAWVDANNLYMYGNTLANDTWYTTYVGCTNESLSEIYMMAHGGGLGVQNITFYISWVAEGDVTNA